METWGVSWFITRSIRTFQCRFFVMRLLCTLYMRARMAQWVRWLDYPTNHTRLPPISRGFASGFVNYKKGALDSQPHVIKLTSCLPMVGSSLWASYTAKTGHHDIAEILLKLALSTNNKSINHLIYVWIDLYIVTLYFIYHVMSASMTVHKVYAYKF